MPLFPLPPVVTLAGLAVILWATWLDEGEGRLALLATLAQILGALAYHRLFLAPRGWKVMLPGEEADA
jgi:hypothetical protein